MARMLGRSRSLRMLRGGHKETHQQDSGSSDRLKAPTPVTTADGRVETPDMLHRPKTSGGPGDRGKLFHKKVAPVALGSEDSKPSFPFFLPNKSTTTILYTAEVREDKEGIIGVALGSPTMHTNWSTAPHTTDFVTSNSGTITHISSIPALEEVHETKQEASKPKPSRWKSIFGKKQHTQEQKTSFYQLAQSAVPTRADSHHDGESIDSRSDSQVESLHDYPRSVSPPTFKPEIRESRKAPKGQEQPTAETRPRALTVATKSSRPKTSLMRSASSPQPPPKPNWNDSPTVPQVVVSGSNPTIPAQANGEKPLLDVDIPSIKMERYSVMFSNLLQPNSNRSSSLLARRQGNSERLKPLNELSVKKEEHESRNGISKPRRATSPSYPKSPSVALSLFPQPTNRAPSPRAVSVHRPRPLQRSKTAPTSSPVRQSFPISTSDDGAKEVPQEVKLQEQTSGKEDPNQRSQLLTPTPSSCCSFDSDSEEVTIVVGRASTTPWKAQLDEPKWEIVSRPSRKTAFTSHPVSTPLEQGPSSAPLESRVKDSAKAQIEPAPRSADQARTPKSQNSPRAQTQNESQATIGVARSVSVSRTSPRSAELLKPTLMKNAAERSLSPGPGGRIVDQKPLTPTLVELKNRKSQRVQLVDA